MYGDGWMGHWPYGLGEVVVLCSGVYCKFCGVVYVFGGGFCRDAKGGE